MLEINIDLVTPPAYVPAILLRKGTILARSRTSLLDAFSLGQILPSFFQSDTNRERAKMKLNIKYYRAVAYWKWAMPEGSDDNCGICRNEFDGTCTKCKFPGEDCPISTRSDSSLVMFGD